MIPAGSAGTQPRRKSPSPEWSPKKIGSIPGATKLHRLEQNFGTGEIELTAEDLCELDVHTSQIDVQGARYSEAAQKMVNRRRLLE